MPHVTTARPARRARAPASGAPPPTAPAAVGRAPLPARAYAASMAREYFTDGKPSGEGGYRDGERHGPWTFYFRNGRVKAQGAYADGEPDGAWTWFREGGGPLQEGSFKDGLRDGRWRRWHATGHLLDEGVYRLGRKTGEWITYDESGGEVRRRNHR